MIAYFTRVYGYTLLSYSTRYYLLLLELLHGFTFATVWLASIDYVKEIAPEGWLTTFTSLFKGIYGLIGASMGSYIGGYEMKIIGYRSVYRYASYLIGILFFIHLFLSIILRFFTK